MRYHTIRKVNYGKVREAIAERIRHTDSIQEFTKNIADAVENNTKYKRIRIRGQRWIPKEYNVKSKSKTKMYMKLKARNFENTNLLAEYKLIKNKLNNVIKKTKKEYILKQLMESKNDLNLFWETFNYTTFNEDKNLSKREDTTLRNENLIEIKNKEDIANIFNNYFETVADKLESNILDFNKIKPV